MAAEWHGQGETVEPSGMLLTQLVNTAVDLIAPRPAEVVAAAERAIDAGRYDEAEKQFATLLQQNGENAYLLARLAGAQLDQDKVGPAEEQLKKLLAVDPANPAGLQMMGDHFSEARLLGIAHRYQQVTDWHARSPGL